MGATILIRQDERRPGLRLRAAGIEPGGIGLVQELRDQAARAISFGEVAGGGEDDLSPAGQEHGHLLSPVRRRDWIEAARQEQDRNAGPHRRGEVRGEVTCRRQQAGNGSKNS